MPIFKNRTIFLIIVIGTAIMLGTTLLIVSKLPPAEVDHKSHFPWIVFLPIYIALMAAHQRKKAQSKTAAENKNRDGDNT